MGKMVDKGKIITIAASALFCMISVTTLGTETPYIDGISTATLITEAGPYQDWYLYEVFVEWNLDGQGTGLSHWDVKLKTGCANTDHLIEFDTPAGYSTTEDSPTDPTAMGWSGYFIRTGDPTVPGDDPVLKYNDPYYPLTAEPGPVGYGTFYFYANIIPENGTYAGGVIAKYGTTSVAGDLTGDYPSCTVIPEPGSILLFGLVPLLLRKKRR